MITYASKHGNLVEKYRPTPEDLPIAALRAINRARAARRSDGKLTGGQIRRAVKEAGGVLPDSPYATAWALRMAGALHQREAATATPDREVEHRRRRDPNLMPSDPGYFPPLRPADPGYFRATAAARQGFNPRGEPIGSSETLRRLMYEHKRRTGR